MTQDKTPAEKRVALLQQLVDRYSDDELRTLCFGLGVNYEDLPAQTRAGKAREFVAYLDRYDRIHELEQKLEATSKVKPQAQTPLQAQQLAPVLSCPFVAGGKIEDPRLFVGRKEELRRITVLMTGVHPTSVNVCGERRIGKERNYSTAIISC